MIKGKPQYAPWSEDPDPPDYWTDEDYAEMRRRLRAHWGTKDASWREEDHPRGQPENKGQFGPGGGSSSSTSSSSKSRGLPKRSAISHPGATAAEALASASARRAGKKTGADGHPGEGYSKNAKVINGVIHTSDVDDAAKALTEHRKVELDQPRGVSIVLDRLAEIAESMIEKGEKAPTVNLCNLTVSGSNLFCSGNMDKTRDTMPQMDEEQTKGFIKYLQGKGYKVSEEEQFASHLRATQNELNGVKVAGIAKAIRAGKFDPTKTRTVISDDDYVLDGHHRWAAKVGNDSHDNVLTNDTKYPCSRVHIKITKLLEEAEIFTGGKGKKGVGEGTETPQQEKKKHKDAWDESKHTRVPAGSSEGGEFSEGGSGSVSRFESMSPSQVTSEMRKLHKQTVQAPLDAAEREIVREYTDYAYREHNAYLRKGEVASGAYEPALKRQIGVLAGAILDTSLPEDMTLYRKFGDKTTVNRLQNLAEGETFTDKGFVSAAADVRGIQAGYDGDFVEIRVPKGTQALPANGYSSSESEYEVILPPGSTFKVVRRKGAGKLMAMELVKGMKKDKFTWEDKDLVFHSDVSDWDESKHARGKTTPESTPGSFAPGGGGEASTGKGGNGEVRGPTARTAKPHPYGLIEADVARYKTLKTEWAQVNNELLEYVDVPDGVESQAKMDRLKEIVQEMQKLRADPGTAAGIGLPGGPHDVVIVGAGPGGLAAGINGAAEGLDTRLIEANVVAGGQAKFSSRIENFPGFPVGVTGERLTQNMFEQATRLGAATTLGVRVTAMTYDANTGLKHLTLSNGEEVKSRAVILAGGLEFRRMNFPGSEGPGVIVGDGKALAKAGKGGNVTVIGGSNGAAQAALGAARSADHVYLMARSPIVDSMSDYQVSAIRANPKVTVLEGDSIAKLNRDADNNPKSMETANGKTVPIKALGIFIGSAPDTKWVPAEVATAKGGRIQTNDDLETPLPGVYAIGDVRHNAIGRIGVAVGEGQMALRQANMFLEEQRTKYHERKGHTDSIVDADERGLPITRLFDLDRDNPWFGQTIEGVEPPRVKDAEEE